MRTWAPRQTGDHVALASQPAPRTPVADLPPRRFLDREASWLAFNRRVLELALDPTVPLLERTKFLAIFSTNLDEFFMVRAAGLKRRIATGLAVTAPSGLTAREQLEHISERAHELVLAQARCFIDDVLPALDKEGIDVLRWGELDGAEQDQLHSLFRERVYPVLTPLAVDPAHPFPYISGLSLNLAVVVKNPETGVEHFARVKVPPLLPRLVLAAPQRFVPLEDVIGAHLQQLFPGMEVLQWHTFRVTRNADLEVDEDEVENLLQALERELLRRRFGPPVRLEVEESMDPHVLDLLVRELGVGDAEVYRVPGPVDLSALWAVAELDRPDLKYQPFVPVTHPRLLDAEKSGAEKGGPGDFFATLRQGDVLVHHPYDSFATSVQAFIERAATDPDVLAIKQTLYRTSGDSPIVDALIDAAEMGKQVLVLVELKARFDEQANIRWARALERAGCHVVYGLVGLKTHCKLCLVVRQEPDGLRRYAHIGTGNYNPKTARLYEDLGLLTADPEVGSDLTDFFNHLSGYSRRTGYNRLLVAPNTLRDGLVDRIDREARAARAGRPAAIRMKVNSIVDEVIIDALYHASQAGVPVDLVVRGMSALRPGVPGLSETIRVRSVLGRFLEHSRIFSFAADGEHEVYIASADLMHRNLDRRVEAAVRVTDPAAKAEITEMLDLAMADRPWTWSLDPDGEWNRSAPGETDRPVLGYQEELLRRKRQRTPVDA
ncbi:MAG: RNA degradosome polyphosphate kinase [Mycobacteriales bacterium]